MRKHSPRKRLLEVWRCGADVREILAAIARTVVERGKIENPYFPRQKKCPAGI
jgi:hypothetical protein